MFESRDIEDIAKKLYASLPENLKGLEAEIEQKFKAVLQSAFEHLDLVTRAEFDVQVKVLERTRAKIEALQIQLDQIKAEKKK